MKTLKRQITAVLLLVTTTISFGQNPSWDQLAKRIVNQTANVKAGNVVLIEGGKHTVQLMEEIAAEVHRKGAHPMMLVNSDIALKAMLHDKPEANLSDYPKHFTTLLKQVDITIQLPDSEDIMSVYKDVDPKRSALMNSNNSKILNELSSGSTHSSINISFPTKQIA